MNRIYRTLWSAATQSWQAVPETAKSAGKKSKSSAGGIVASVALGFSLNGVAHAQAPPALPPAINQLPTGGTVVRGTATTQQTVTAQAAAMTVNQSSQRAVVNWNTFNLGSAASINFVQPNAQSVTLNRVNDSNPSQIFGRITANGQVFLTNASGVYFSPSSSVDVGAITATTHSITDDNFMSGKYVFDRNGSTGKVINEGHITAALGGYVALLAPEVQNAGVVVARAGTVAMAAGELITLSVDGAGSLAGITTTPSAIASLVENKLAVLAPDGQIILSAVALDKLQAGVVKNSGTLEANRLVNKGGKIVLEGDNIVMDRNSKIEATGRTGGGVVLVGGDWQGSGDLRQATKVILEAGATIDASATDNGDGGKVVLWSDIHNADSVTRVNGSIKADAGPNGGDGGQIETSGYVLNVDGIQVSTKAAQGQDGMWLLDPYNITISTTLAGTPFVDANNSGDDTYNAADTSTIKAADINSALANGNVTISTGVVGSAGADAGNITISSTLAWATSNVLTLSAATGVTGTSGISMTGSGRLIVDQAGTSTYSGVISGTGSVTKKGSGTLTLRGANTYTGSTNVSEGILDAGVASVAGVSGAFGYNSAVTLADVSGATLKISAATQIGSLSGGGTTGGGITWSSSSNALTVGTNNTDTTFSGNFLSAGSLTKVGTGTLKLSGSASFQETFTVNNGILQLGSSNIASYALNSSSATTVIVNNGGTFDLNGFSGLTGSTGGKMVLNGPGYNNLGALRNGATGTTSTFISRYWNWGTNPSISAVGNVVIGTYYDCNGTTAGSCAAPTVNINGTGIVDISLITGATQVNPNGAPAYNVIGGTLKNNASSGSNFGTVNLSSGTTYNLTFSGNNTYRKLISGSGGLTIDNTNLAATNTLTLAGANTYTGPTSINSGYVTTGLATVNDTSGPLGVNSAITIANAARTGLTLGFNTQIGSLSGGGANGGNLNLNGSTLSVGANNIDSTYNGVISDTNLTPVGVLNKIGTGVLTLTGSNTYVGLTSISAGSLRAASNTALGTIAGGVTVANGATLEIGGPASPSGLDIGAEALTIADGGAIHNVAGYNTYAGAMTFSGNASITIDTGTSLNFTPTGNPGITVAAGKRLSLYTNGDLTFGKALLAGDANSSYLKVGSGTLTIPSSSTLTAAIGVYAGLFDPTGTDYSSEYGSAPDYTVAFYNATSGGARISLTSGTDYTGTAAWTGLVPTSISNAANNYSLTYASGLTISNSRYVLIGATSAKNWTVTPKTVTVSLTSPSSTYTYDAVTSYATLASGLTAYTTNTPMVGSDSIASLNYAVTSNGVAVSTGVAQAGNFSVTPSLNNLSVGAAASNYSFTFNPLIVAVAKATLTVGGTPIAANKTYDRTTVATISGGSLVGVLGNDSVTLTEAGTFATANVGTGISVTANDTLSGSSASNYTLTQPTGLSADITPKALTVNNTTVANKAYSGTNTATLSGGTLVGVIAGDTVTLNEAGTFASVNASSSPIAVTAADTLSGGSAGNYTITQPTGLSGYINKANATVTASSSSVTYTGLAQSVSGFTTTGLVNGETAAVLSGVSAGATGTNAGSYASVASGTDGNYNLTFVNGALTINKANATVTASSGSTTYNGLAQSVSGFTVTGLVNNEAPAVLTGVSAGVTATNAGTYASTASGTDTNYNLTFVNGAFTINKANATVTANSGAATYTGVAQSVSGFTATGLVNGEAATVLTGVSASGTGTNAGTYASTASGTDINYNLTFAPGALTINKAHLTVTANNASKTYGDTNPALSATVSGFVNGETLGTSGVSGAGAASTTATALTGAGTATITPSLGTLAASNYDFTNWVNGTLTINKANATVTASSGTVTYTGLAQSVSGFTASGLVNGEAATVLTGVSTSGGTSGGTGTNAGNYTHIASGTDSNYNLTFVNGALTIGKANATVIANGGTTTYNGAAQSVSGFTATGLVNGETTAVLSGVTAGATGTNAGTYTSTASGTDSNYNLSFTNGTYTINKAPLTVSLTGQTKVYDGTTSATLANGSLTLTGFMSGEGATVSQTQASYNSAHVLNATTVTASLAAGNYTASNGTLLSNYVLPTTASGTGSITPARLSATGTKTYDGLVAFDATGLTVSGVNGETFAATGSGTMGSKNVQTNQALSSIAGLSLSGNNGALASNYVALATSDTQVSVTPLAVNLSAPAATKTYDSTTLYQVSAADLATLSSQLVGNDRVTAADVVYATKDAGTGKRVSLNSVTISDDNGGNNYTVGKLDVTTGVINKAQLTVSVVSDARFVTQSDAAGYAGVVYNGFVGGETASVLTAGNITRSNAGVNGAGQYTGVLQASGWQSGNYNFNYHAGDYTIAGAHTLLVSVPTASTTYGTAATYVPTAKYLDSNNNHIVTLTPTMTGNALTLSDGAGGTASFAITAANATLSNSGNVQAGGYNLVASNVVKTGDNFQNLVMTGGLTVTPKVLNNNLGVQAITKVYDGSASISNLGLSFNQPLAGVVSGDTVSLVGSGSFDDRHVAANKTVNLSLGLLGADAANYALATPSFSTNTGAITQLASVTYTGATNGNWADFSNWAGGAMPDRNNVAQVIVPTGKTVVYNSDQVGTIGSTLAVDGAIRFTSSNAFTLANTVSGTGDLQQRGNGMLTVSGANSNFSGSLDIGSYQATLNNAQALGAAGHVVSSGGQLSLASGVTLAALHVDGAMTVDTAIKTTGDQVYNGALTFLSSGTVQAPNFVSDAGNVDFLSTVSAGSGAMTAQRSLAVSAPHGSVLFNDQVGRLVKNLDFNTYLTTGLLDTSPYALTVTAPTIKLFGDVTTFESQTYDGAVRVGNNGQNGHTRLLVSVDPSITFKGTVDDADPTGKVNGLDVRAISLSAIAANAPVPTITFENNVGSTSPLASLRLAAGTQSTVSGAMVTDIKTDDASRRDTNYKGDIVLKGDLTVDAAPEMIAEQLLVPNGSPTLTWYTGTPDFRLRLPVSASSSTPPSNLQLVQWGQGSNSNSGNTNTSSTNNRDITEAGRQWLMARNTHERTTQFRANETAMKAMDTPSGRMVADVQVGNETSTMPTVAGATSPRAQAQTVNVSSSGAFVQVREFAPQTFETQQAFVYQLPADTFVHSHENEYIKLSVTLSNGARLPRWVKFSVKDRSFSGEAPKHVKSLDVKVTATDRQGKRASTRIRLVFTNGSIS